MGAMIILFSAGQPIFIFPQVGKMRVIIIMYIVTVSYLVFYIVATKIIKDSCAINACCSHRA